MTIILIALATFVATLIGGLFALYLSDRLHLILGFSAGAVIAVAFFDLLPEAIHLGSTAWDVGTITTFTVGGFMVYMILDRFIGFHGHADDHDAHPHAHAHTHQHSGTLGAASLSTHSFLDGLAIGLAFQVSAAVGAIVATAVLVHDFSDGINTVNFVVKNTQDRQSAFRWLLIDAVAPVLGVITTFFFTLPQSILSLVLAIFSGFFLYIGASDLLPESYHDHPRVLTTLMTIAGVVVLFIAIHIAG